MDTIKKYLLNNTTYIFAWILFIIFAPTSIFLGNVDEFEVDFGKVVPILVAVSLFWWGGLTVIGVALNKKELAKERMDTFIFSLSFCGYMQLNFLNGNLPELNGNKIDWDYASWQSITSTLCWGLILLLPQMLYKKHKTIIERVKLYGSIFLSAVLLCTTMILILTTKRMLPSENVVTKYKEFELAKNENLIIFIVDTLDAAWADKYILRDETYKGMFDDFIYYDNVVSGGAPTHLGMPALLTGITYDNPKEMSLDDYYKKAYSESTLFRDLREEGVTVRLYTGIDMLNHADISCVDNIREDEYEIDSKLGFTECLYKLTGFCVAPYIVKKIFTMYGGDFSKNIGISEGLLYTYDDPQFYLDLCNSGLTIGNSKKAFTLYHLYGAHPPYSMDENAKSVKENSCNREDQIHGCCKILNHYFSLLKNIGLYDDSTIIVMADHGGVDVYQNPAVFVKYKNGINQEKGRNSKPAMFTNIYATIASILLEDSTNYGEGLLDDLSFYNETGRSHTAKGVLYVQSKRSKKATGDPYDVYKIQGKAGDRLAVVEPSNKVQLGDELSADNISYRAKTGFSASEKKYIWTDGKEAILDFELEDDYKNLRLDMSYFTYLSQQSVDIYINDYLISKFKARGEEDKTIYIPGNLINGKLEMKFILQDAVSPAEIDINNKDKRVLALAIKGMKFTNSMDDVDVLKQIDGGIHFGEKIVFNKATQESLVFLTDGFSILEQDGVWNESKEAKMTFYIDDPKQNIWIDVEHLAFNNSQRVSIYANGELVDKYVAQGLENHRIEISKSIVKNGKLDLEFELFDSVSPKNLGQSDDDREIALFFKSIVIEDSIDE